MAAALIELGPITNPDFEVNSTGWTAFTACTIAQSTTQAKFGTGSLAVTATSNAAQPGVTAQAVVSGQQYLANLWVYTPRAGTYGLQVRDSGSVWSATGANVVLSANTWTLLLVTVTPSNANAAIFRLLNSAGNLLTGDIVYWDAARLIPTSATSTAANAITAPSKITLASTATSTASGATTAPSSLSTSAAATSTASNAITAATGLTLSGSATSTTSGAATAPSLLTVTASAASSSAATVTTTSPLTGSATASSSAVAVVTVAASFTATAQATSTSTGNLTAVSLLVAQAVAGSTATSSFTALALLTATASASSSTTGTVSSIVILSGNATASSTASATIVVLPSGNASATINGTPVTSSRAFPPGQPLNLACSFTDLNGNPTDCTVTLTLIDSTGLPVYPTLIRGVQGSVSCQVTPPTPSVGIPPRQGSILYGSAPWTVRWQAVLPFIADTGPIQFSILPCLA